MICQKFCQFRDYSTFCCVRLTLTLRQIQRKRFFACSSVRILLCYFCLFGGQVILGCFSPLNRFIIGKNFLRFGFGFCNLADSFKSFRVCNSRAYIITSFPLKGNGREFYPAHSRGDYSVSVFVSVTSQTRLRPLTSLVTARSMLTSWLTRYAIFWVSASSNSGIAFLISE